MSDEKVVRVGVAVLIRKNGRYLFGLRKGKHGPGTWSLPGGHLEFGEEVEACARREVLEETGLKVGKIEMYSWYPYANTHFRETGKQYITLYMEAEYLGGDPVVMEPEKCSEWGWYSSYALPRPLFEPIEKEKLFGQ